MKRFRKSNNGSALVVTMGFVLVSSALAAAILTTASTHHRLSARQVAYEKAFLLAEAGLEDAAAHISAQRGYIFADTPRNAYMGDGSFQVMIRPSGYRQFQLSSTGTVNGVNVRLKVDRAWMPSYATYALWSDQNNPIYFTLGEEFFGKVHANDTLYFDSYPWGGPVFWEKLSSGADSYVGSVEYVTFHKGFEYPESMPSLVNSVDFDEMKSLASTHGRVLEGNTTIEFDDEKIKVTNARAGMNRQQITLGPNELLYVKNSATGTSSTRPGKVNIEGGRIDGRLTVVAENDIRIEDHIRYKKDPRNEPSDNALGLISKDDVWIDPDAPANLDVHAAIMAVGAAGGGNRGSFGVLEYNQGHPKGFLKLLGSIVQDMRGAVGTYYSSDGSPASGYTKWYSFDERFLASSPPFYPVISEDVIFSGWGVE